MKFVRIISIKVKGTSIHAFIVNIQIKNTYIYKKNIKLFAYDSNPSLSQMQVAKLNFREFKHYTKLSLGLQKYVWGT